MVQSRQFYGGIMKIFSKTLMILTAVVFAAPAFAQISKADSNLPWSWSSQADARATRSIIKAAKTSHEKHDEALRCKAEELLQQDRDAHKGYAQHDLDYYYNLLKGSAQPAAAQQATPKDPALLQVAEAMLQYDRDTHNGYAQHDLDYYYNLLETQIFTETKAQPKNARSAEYCIYCGEEITSDYQKCPAQEAAPCRATCPDCGKDLRDTKNLINGEHRCRFKTRIIPVAPKVTEKSGK